MLEFDELRQLIAELKNGMATLQEALSINQTKDEIAELEIKAQDIARRPSEESSLSKKIIYISSMMNKNPANNLNKITFI